MPNIKKATKTVTSEDATDKELAVIAQTGLREVIRTPITPLDLGEPILYRRASPLNKKIIHIFLPPDRHLLHRQNPA